jgi:hypothetical protein
MSFIKTMVTTVNINEPSQIYNKDPKKMLLELLEKKFEGRCMNSSYIVKVLSIENEPMIEFSNELLDGSATCDIIFKAECINYHKGTIVVAKFLKYIDTLAKFVTDEADIMIIKNKNTIFEEGDLVPITITSAIHLLNTRIATHGDPYYGRTKDMYYSISTTEIRPDLTKTYDTIVKKIKAAKKKMGGNASKIAKVLHPIKKTESKGNPIDDYKFGSVDTAKLMMVSKHSPYEDLRVVTVPAEGITRVNTNYASEQQVVIELASITLNFLEMCIELDSRGWKESNRVWKLYKSFQK